MNDLNLVTFWLNSTNYKPNDKKPDKLSNIYKIFDSFQRLHNYNKRIQKRTFAKILIDLHYSVIPFGDDYLIQKRMKPQQVSVRDYMYSRSLVPCVDFDKKIKLSDLFADYEKYCTLFLLEKCNESGFVSCLEDLGFSIYDSEEIYILCTKEDNEIFDLKTSLPKCNILEFLYSVGLSSQKPLLYKQRLSLIYERYLQWCSENNEDVEGITSVSSFAKRLRQLNFNVAKSNGNRSYVYYSLST